jgi:hypothetical protein
MTGSLPLYTHIQTVRKKDGIQGKKSSLRPRPGAETQSRLCSPKGTGEKQAARCPISSEFLYHFGLAEESPSNAFPSLLTYIQLDGKKDEVEEEIFPCTVPDAVPTGGTTYVFHSMPPNVSVKWTETRENELKKGGIWSSGGRMPHPVERLRKQNYKIRYCEESQMSRHARSFINYIIQRNL